MFAGQCGTQCEYIIFSQVTSMQSANYSHWTRQAECEFSWFSQDVQAHSTRTPVTNENFEKASKIQTSLCTQKVSQEILRIQTLTKQEKKENRENGHRKFKNHKDKRDISPTELLILFQDKSMSADTKRSS
jgi:hypothetical protein